jgi:hypothetical protein
MPRNSIGISGLSDRDSNPGHSKYGGAPIIRQQLSMALGFTDIWPITTFHAALRVCVVECI